jgi:hypothetical protein
LCVPVAVAVIGGGSEHARHLLKLRKMSSEVIDMSQRNRGMSLSANQQAAAVSRLMVREFIGQVINIDQLCSDCEIDLLSAQTPRPGSFHPRGSI